MSIPACKRWMRMTDHPCCGYASKHQDADDKSHRDPRQTVMRNLTTAW